MSGMEEPLMRHGDRYDTGTGYGTPSYMKPTAFSSPCGMSARAFLKAYRVRSPVAVQAPDAATFNTWRM
jgi:hypothetical protein